MPKLVKKSQEEIEGPDYSNESVVEEEESFSHMSAYGRKDKLKEYRLKQRRIYKKKMHGSWSLEEEEKFLTFMKDKHDVLRSKERRRS